MEPVPIIDSVFLLVDSICSDVRQGRTSYDQLQESKERSKEMYPLFLRMEEKMLKDLNSIGGHSKDILSEYAYSMNKYTLRKHIKDLQGKLLQIENLTLAQMELEAEKLPQIYFNDDGAPVLHWFEGECNQELLDAMEYNRINLARDSTDPDSVV